jgi:hypothetical protein
MAATFAFSGGTESQVSQPTNTSIPTSQTDPQRNWVGLVRTSSGESISQPYRPLSVVHRQSSIRSNEEPLKANRETSQQSSTSNASIESMDTAAVPSLEQEANQY